MALIPELRHSILTRNHLYIMHEANNLCIFYFDLLVLRSNKINLHETTYSTDPLHGSNRCLR